MDEPIVQQLLDRAEIADVVTRVATCADARDWAGVRACFTDELDLDYTSLSGGTSVRLRADDLVAQWQQTLSGFEATHHLLANQLITVNGDEATCFAYVQATHLLPTRTSTGSANQQVGKRIRVLPFRCLRRRWFCECGTIQTNRSVGKKRMYGTV